ncbi:MAG: hypothetical protein ACP59X_19730 [Solidesulfovibrio sp. DCME]|uniref:hypothetical protein n=1 Tax=Solidesulfovibrio sp. DCME TaxID=3447380 RepID=UPI003D11D6C4
MAHAVKTGRPAKSRHPVAGEHLRQALKVLGKTWRKNVHDPDHVRNWEAWSAQALPRSPTTIDADMRLGVPEERLVAYAQCLGISPRTLLSPGTDIRAALGMSRPARFAGAAAPGLGFAPPFTDDYLAYNAAPALKKLFELVGGVYRAHYLLSITEEVHHCAFWFAGTENHRLLGHGFFVRYGLDTFFRSTTFRWHNNLHTLYLCDNNKELGHFLLVDPSRHNLIASRRPFRLFGQGVTDSGLADNAPVLFTFGMERLDIPGGLSPGTAWDRACDAVRERPSVRPGEADYETARAAVSAQPFTP